MKVFIRILAGILLAGLVLLTVSMAVKVNRHRKIVMESSLSSDRAWKMLTGVDDQLFWRADLINIVEISGKKGSAWKEIFTDDSERFYELTEHVPGERMVKSFRLTGRGRETVTIVVRPAGAGSRIALIHSVSVLNPVDKVRLKRNPEKAEILHARFDYFVEQFTNALRRDDRKSGSLRTVPVRETAGEGDY